MSEGDLSLRALVAFRRANRAIREHEGDAVRARGLTPPQFGVLETLHRCGPMRVGQIIEEMLATSGNMTVIVRNLERDGLVRRECDPADHRSFIVDLTDKGRSLIEEILPEHAENIRGIMSALSDDEKRQLIALAKKFAQ